RSQPVNLLLPAIDDLELGEPETIIRDRGYAGHWMGTAGQNSGGDHFFRETAIAGRTYYLTYRFYYYRRPYRIELATRFYFNPAWPELEQGPLPCEQGYVENNPEYCRVIPYLQTTYASQNGVIFSPPSITRKSQRISKEPIYCDVTTQNQTM